MEKNTETAIDCGIGIGSVLAMILSYSINKSILWCLLHCFLGWIYVVYFAFFH
jgi:p-aminobenzoyl-glutamate transporter AbgT